MAKSSDRLPKLNSLKLEPLVRLAPLPRSVTVNVPPYRNKPVTAQELGISLKTLYNKLNAYEEQQRRVA